MPRIICYRSHSETPFHGVSFYFPSILSLLLFFIFINSLSFSLSFLSRFFSCSQPFTGFLLFQHTFRLFSFMLSFFSLLSPALFICYFIYLLLTYLLTYLLTHSFSYLLPSPYLLPHYPSVFQNISLHLCLSY